MSRDNLCNFKCKLFKLFAAGNKVGLCIKFYGNTDAVFVDSAGFTLAFPAGSCYDVYGFTEAQGFFLLSRIETGEDWSAGVRGVNASGYEYLAGGKGVTVIDMNRSIIAARVEF